MSLSNFCFAIDIIVIVIIIISSSISICVVSGSVAEQNSCRSVDAAIRLPGDGGTYFFSGSRYLEYDKFNSVERRTGPVARLGLNGVDRTDAAFRYSEHQVVLTSGCMYYRYNMTSLHNFRNEIVRGNLTDLGLPCDVEASFLGPRNQVRVTKECTIWTFNQESHQFVTDPSLNLTSLGVPCSLDAAVSWSDETELLIKGHLFWKMYHNDVITRDDVEGPFHTDDLNICSWFICGEANFTRPSSEHEEMACNGDKRLCPLRLDQVTLPGLHNAGAGFSNGFGMFDCWVRNHGKSIYEQMKLGIRHLDIDPCYDRCGFLGSCHSYFCGGSICAIIKQTRRFLLEHPDQVVTMNFNHEILEPRKVFRELTRQLKTQLGPMLSHAFRHSDRKDWPTLQDSIGSNRRVFVFYAYIIEREPYAPRFRRFKWIHTENWLGSTWDEIYLTPGCRELIPTTRRMCYRRQYRELVEVTAAPTPEFSTCITEIADTCRPRLVETLRACESYRYRLGKSPNILLVDYPEINPQEVTSAFHAVYLQNVRNVLQHRPSSCQVEINAAYEKMGNGFFFSRTKLVTYDFSLGMQVQIRSLPLELHNVEAAFLKAGEIFPTVVKDCQAWRVDFTGSTNQTQGLRLDLCNQTGVVDAAAWWQDALHLFQGCSVIRTENPEHDVMIDINDWGLPCHVDAALTSPDGTSLYVFKDNRYWKYAGDGPANLEGLTKSWKIDVVRCDDSDGNK